LGEAARTDADARRYHLSYTQAITALAKVGVGQPRAARPEISVKLSALHPRYETAQRDRVMAELVGRLRSLALLAASVGVGLNVDAEEADRLDLSLDVIEAVVSDPALAGWDGFGIAVQAYGPRALPVINWIYDLAGATKRRLMVRLVKGAYWDTEIKRAQVKGLDGFPVFTRKTTTDISYIACARRLLDGRDRLYPQFATHNAHTAATVLEMAGDDREGFELQRLHGMGESLHAAVKEAEGNRCRIYAPVGAHRDLLAYLVRRLLENGANSSFVNQIVDPAIAPETIAADPFTVAEGWRGQAAHPKIKPPPRLFEPERRNSRGWDLAEPADLEALEALRAPYRAETWAAAPLLAMEGNGREERAVRNPADPADEVGRVTDATVTDVALAVDAAAAAAIPWANRPAGDRAAILERAAELYEAHAGELFALCAREAGKTLGDAVAELREAVDFLYYYAAEARRLGQAARGCGVFACISPWNFPLAIFTGQIAAALAAGNAVIAKPAEQTPLIAHRAVRLLHEAGVPSDILQLVIGDGPSVGAALSADRQIAGMCFTGSLETAQAIHRTLALAATPEAPLIAETGGLNAMIVDSTALPEQSVADILASAFQSAGQRCSALRILYVQADIYDRVVGMLRGAMDLLRLGDPWDLATDIGPVIDAEAKAKIEAHIAKASAEERLLKQLDVPEEGLFVGPALLRVDGIDDLEEEIFGPVLHVARFGAEEIDAVVDAINAKGYGLTFGLHTRIDDRVQQVVERVRAGNIYVNRNQIGAIVGSQPFGGEGLSGTGPKAGGPDYVARFCHAHLGPGAWGDDDPVKVLGGDRAAADTALVQSRLNKVANPPGAPLFVTDLPGPTGETNRLSTYPRGVVLCLGPGAEAAAQQAAFAKAQGCTPVMVAPGVVDGDIAGVNGRLDPTALADLTGFDAVLFWGTIAERRAARRALAQRPGPIVPLIQEAEPTSALRLERHLCVDTTASGGNASLLAESS
ncbi:MAG: bifunctional proline dehydrogenase/L-glutamate gamma-semialdehyde dehydrogenase PutA, partial [Rhodospirillaceae bacterium]|nr:bifunctional proline dehydrogenase/L-glutamate gamma-semialdehyde dehydrogenase PutA [Rhodospirillaceae bacterium]